MHHLLLNLPPANLGRARWMPGGRAIAFIGQNERGVNGLFVQDFVPGIVIPVHFTATQLGKHEIVCTQLCGLGHYNMRAFLEVMTPEQFNQWLIDQAPF